MLVKFEQNRMVQTTQNFELFDKKQNKTKQGKQTNKKQTNKNKQTNKQTGF